MAPRKRLEIKFAPRDVFENVLEYAVIPTFDLVVEPPGTGGVVLVRRTIAPCQNKWALPGLRMFKPEAIDDVIARIAEGRTRPPGGRRRRTLPRPVRRPLQDRARAAGSLHRYVVKALTGDIQINRDHFSGHQIIKKWDDVPTATGAMYRYYLAEY